MTDCILSAFSGIGTKIFANRFLNKKEQEDNHIEIIVKNEKNFQDQKVEVIKEKTETEKIADRFNHVLTLINKGAKTNISELAQEMNLSKTSELENFFTGSDEPTFEFMRKFCDTFGVNYEWLSKGVESPYSNNNQTEYDPFNYFNKIININPKRIYFVQANTEKAETFIVLKLSDYKYEILQKEWHISSHVGRGGTSQIMGLYYLLRKLDIGRYSSPSYYGIVLEKDDYYDLFMGNIFPGQYLHRPKISHWCDDITDIYYKYPIADKYSQYGKSFADAQNIIRIELEYNKKSYEHLEKDLKDFKENRYKINALS